MCVVAPHGRAVWLEVKTGSGRLMANQKRFKELVERHGAVFAVVRSVEEALAVVWDVYRPEGDNDEQA